MTTRALWKVVRWAFLNKLNWDVEKWNYRWQRRPDSQQLRGRSREAGVRLWVVFLVPVADCSSTKSEQKKLKPRFAEELPRLWVHYCTSVAATIGVCYYSPAAWFTLLKQLRVQTTVYPCCAGQPPLETSRCFSLISSLKQKPARRFKGSCPSCISAKRQRSATAITRMMQE